MHSAFGKAPAIEGKSDSLDPLRYLWIGRRGRYTTGGKARGFDSYSEAHRHATFRPAASLPVLRPSPFFFFSHSFAFSHTLLVALTNLPAACTHKRTHTRTHTHHSGVVRLAFHPTTEKQDGDLWDDAGRRHPFNGLPKRLNFVADPAIRAGSTFSRC